MGVRTGILGLAGAVCLAAMNGSATATEPAPASAASLPAASAVPGAEGPSGAEPDTVRLSEDGLTRMTIPVVIDGKGPFPFVIDTGADRTVISQELAAVLKLPAGPHVSLQNSGGVDDVSTVLITTLGVGNRSTGQIEAPVLARANLGAAGMLGIDSLKDQHVVMDFKTKRLESMASRPEIYDPNTIVVRGKSRFGQLVIVDAHVGAVAVFVILDSGAQNTVGNLALQALLSHRSNRRPEDHAQVISVTGRQTPAEFTQISEVNIGGLTIRNVPLAFADLHTFHRFDLVHQPAMLLGMDVLMQCEKVTVDFKRREATFTLN